MRVFKRFLVQVPKVLDDSYVSAAVDGPAVGLSIHDGKNTLSFNFNTDDELDRAALAHVVAGLEAAIGFIKKTHGGGTVAGLTNRLLSAVLSQRKTPTDCQLPGPLRHRG